MIRLRLFFRYLYTLDHYHGVEKITIWGYIYKKRIGVRRAWRISKELNKIIKGKLEQ